MTPLESGLCSARCLPMQLVYRSGLQAMRLALSLQVGHQPAGTPSRSSISRVALQPQNIITLFFHYLVRKKRIQHGT